MESKCVTIEYLKQLAAVEMSIEGVSRVGVVGSALRIISDIQEYRMTPMDLECLHWMVDSIVEQGHGDLLSHLHDAAADCGICAAMTARRKTLAPQA